MTDSLAKQLGLKPEQKELLSIITFGAGKATNIDTYVVKFNVKLKDGSSMLLFANVLKQITGNIQRSPLHQNDVEFLKLIPSHRLADPIPCTQRTSTVDLLIGPDYFWDIVGGDKVTLPSGMFMLPSKFGYIVTGRSPGTNKDSQSGNYCTFAA